MPVLYWEEPLDSDDGTIFLECGESAPGITVATPRLPAGLSGRDRTQALRTLLDTALEQRLEAAATPLIRWYYTPMMLDFSRHLDAACTVYDCMDELANFLFAPPELAALESELFAAADLVFTGGYSLYEAKRTAHAPVPPSPPTRPVSRVPGSASTA